MLPFWLKGFIQVIFSMTYFPISSCLIINVIKRLSSVAQRVSVCFPETWPGKIRAGSSIDLLPISETTNIEKSVR